MHSNLPLEEAILSRAKSMAPNSYYYQEAYNRHRNNFICFDIHKRFIPEIQENLESRNVNVTTNNVLFDFNNLKNDFNFKNIISH